MDQIWETLTKSFEKLQKNQTTAQVESHSNCVHMEKQMKNLKYENISIITLEGDHITTSIVLIQLNTINQRRVPTRNG
ncbi:unnamed protein product [Malus baccata var. baccata]